MPPRTKKVDRSTPYGNPYSVSSWVINHCGGDKRRAAQIIVNYFEQYLRADEQAPLLEQIKRELAGYDLACWCSLDSPCHADMLLKVANEGETAAGGGTGGETNST